MEFGIVVNEDFNLFTGTVKGIAGSGIEKRRILVVSCHGRFLHTAGAVEKGADVEPGHGYRKEAHRGENRETATDIVGDHKRLVTFFCGELAQRTLMFVGYCNDALRSLSLAELALKLLFEQAEGYCRFGGCARL